MTGTEIINASLRKLWAIEPGEDADPNELADGLQALNAMLGSWSAKKIVPPYTTSESFSLAASTSLYTMGTGGTASSARAKSITGAFVRDSGNFDHYVEIIAEDQYRELRQKSLSTRPYKLFYKPVYPVGLIYVYPTPDTVETMYIDSVKLLSEITDVTAEVSLPSEYMEAVIYNLALREAPEYKVEPSPAVIAMAVESFNTILALNSNTYSEKINPPAGLPGVGRVFNINTGEY